MDNQIFLALKWVCNTNCIFCNFFETKWTINEEEHFEEIKWEIQELYNKWVSRISIWINWYEPTVFRYFFEVLDFVYEKNISVTLFTNGIKLADEEFTKRLSKVLTKVVLTIYSSNDEEHHVLTQNNDSFFLKYLAIENALKYDIQVEVDMLLLTPSINHLDNIIKTISKYFPDKNFQRIIKLLVPSSVMGKERNKILIPSYTSIIKTIDTVLQEHSGILLWSSIIFELNSVIPKCLYSKIIQRMNLSVAKDAPINKEKLNTSFVPERVFFQKCNTCSHLHECNGVEKGYVDIYWSWEIESGIFIENNYTLTQVDNSLHRLLLKYKEEGIWFNHEYLDSWVKEHSKILTLPKKMFNFYIWDVFIVNNSIRRIRFFSEINDGSFIVDINKEISNKYIFSIRNSDSKNIQVYSLIVAIMGKVFNRK